MINPLHIAYKQDTGNRPMESEITIGVVRMRGLWVLDPDEINDDQVLDTFGRGGELIIPIPDLEYIAWLEEKAMNEQSG